MPRQGGPAAGAASGPSCCRTPFPPRGPWPGVGIGLEVGGAPGRLCYQGVSLRKGCRPLPSKAQEMAPGVGKGATPVAGGPWTCHRMKGLSCARAGCYRRFRGPIHVPGGDMLLHTHAPSPHSVPRKRLWSQRTQTGPNTRLPRWTQTVPRNLQTVPVWSHDPTRPSSHAPAHTQASPDAHTDTQARTHSSVTPRMPNAASGPRETRTWQGAAGAARCRPGSNGAPRACSCRKPNAADSRVSLGAGRSPVRPSDETAASRAVIAASRDPEWKSRVSRARAPDPQGRR